MPATTVHMKNWKRSGTRGPPVLMKSAKDGKCRRPLAAPGIGSARRTNGGPRADGEHAREIGGDVGQFKSPLNQPTAEQDIEIAKQEDEREQKELESGETVGVCFTVEEENHQGERRLPSTMCGSMPLATRR